MTAVAYHEAGNWPKQAIFLPFNSLLLIYFFLDMARPAAINPCVLSVLAPRLRCGLAAFIGVNDFEEHVQDRGQRFHGATACRERISQNLCNVALTGAAGMEAIQGAQSPPKFCPRTVRSRNEPAHRCAGGSPPLCAPTDCSVKH